MRGVVQALFLCTRRKKAAEQAIQYLGVYKKLAAQLAEESGQKIVEVPSMPGVDEDMRRWSFYMLLEHNVIVNRSITALVQQLARGEPLTGPATINPKTDVLPSGQPGPEQLGIFETSVHEHIAAVEALLGPLRGTKTTPHPLFGNFDAHKWNCMFALHLKVHFKQAKLIVEGTQTP